MKNDLCFIENLHLKYVHLIYVTISVFVTEEIRQLVEALFITKVSSIELAAFWLIC